MGSISAATRSKMMSRVRSTNTKPEMLVRRYLHTRGFRYRLHDKRLPGSPDLVFPSRRKVIFVHGCFWHQHKECRHGHAPQARVEYWGPKLERNIKRDASSRRQLKVLGWSSYVVWECQLADLTKVGSRLERFLAS